MDGGGVKVDSETWRRVGVGVSSVSRMCRSNSTVTSTGAAEKLLIKNNPLKTSLRRIKNHKFLFIMVSYILNVPTVEKLQHSTAQNTFIWTVNVLYGSQVQIITVLSG